MKIPSRSKAKEDYILFLKSLEVDEIYLSETSASFDRDRSKSSSKQVSIHGQSRSGKPVLSNTGFTVPATMEVLIGAPNPKEAFGRIEVTYVLKFSVRSKELNPEHVNQFIRSTIKVVIWPFFREFIHNMTARFGIPHVNVPIHAE
jgi:preprotein translocase subunit SecB